MVLKHHTLNPFDRKPQGAVATGGQVRLRLTVEDEQAPVELFLRVWNGDERRYPMRPLGLKDGRMIYEAQIGVGDKPRLLWYRFECEYKGEHVVLGAPGDHTGCGEGVMGSEESFQLTVYDAAYDTPAWMRDGVMYQIMVDRFCHGEGTDALMHAKDGQNIILHEDWNEMPFLNIAENGDNFANDFFGGNLEGVRQKLPYLKQLGVSVLYFNPIFCARTNHKYDTSDYRRVDPMFGDEQALARLCKEAEALGMRVMLDGVFSHVGDDSLYFNRRGTYGEHVGAYRDPDSPYYKWFTFRHWPDDYECWWGFKTLPNVNEMDEDYRRFILEDDYDSEFRFTLRPIPTLQSIDHAGRVIYVNTFSRTLAPSLRISYMVLPGELMRVFQKRLGFYSCTVPSFEQYTLARFLDRGDFEKHINRMRKSYKSRRNTVISLLRQCAFSEKLPILEQDAGLHFLLRVDTPLSDGELTARLAQAGIVGVGQEQLVPVAHFH